MHSAEITLEVFVSRVAFPSIAYVTSANNPRGLMPVLPSQILSFSFPCIYCFLRNRSIYASPASFTVKLRLFWSLRRSSLFSISIFMVGAVPYPHALSCFADRVTEAEARTPHERFFTLLFRVALFFHSPPLPFSRPRSGFQFRAPSRIAAVFRFSRSGRNGFGRPPRVTAVAVFFFLQDFL